MSRLEEIELNFKDLDEDWSCHECGIETADAHWLLNLVKKQREALENIALETCDLKAIDGGWKHNLPTNAAMIAKAALKEQLAEPNLCAENKGEGVKYE